MPRYILLRETESTNTYLARTASILPSGTVIHTNNQVAGRGQRGNSWEAEPGKNITFSQLLKSPAVEPARQFYISEAVSLALVDVLSEFVPTGFSIKWPNDIYYNDSKICGILIEHSLCGNSIKHTIVGVGLNVNQEKFLSDAPNPISLLNITGEQHEVDEVLHRVCERIEELCNFAGATEHDFKELHKRYLSHLYRFDGKAHTFELPSGERIEAEIVDVASCGTLSLRHADGSLHDYAFKEVAFMI